MHINFAQVCIQELGYCQSCDMLEKKHLYKYCWQFVQIYLEIWRKTNLTRTCAQPLKYTGAGELRYCLSFDIFLTT